MTQTAVADDYLMRVLLVDDQAIIGEAVRRALSRQPNLEFRYCNESAQAIEVASEFKPTVILQDLVMPGADGLTLLRQYRDHPPTRDIPVIVLSTKEEPAIKSEAFALGASDYLIKLPDAIELIARIRHHSKAYLNQLQRDAAYRALHETQCKLMETNAELQRLTSVDGLTGLSNRRYFDEYMATQWKLAIRERQSFALLMIDVDNFKRYNDTYGHLAGDEVLKSVATAMKNSFLRPTDLPARFGGEEFVVILPDTPHEVVKQLGDRVRSNVEQLRIPHSGSSSGAHLTISVGGASTIPSGEQLFLPLLEAADAALYEAKESGKNRVVVHDHDAQRAAAKE